MAVLDSWYGRRVVVGVQPDGSSWYAMSAAGEMSKRSDIDLEWLADDLPEASEGYEYRLADQSRFQLMRVEFQDATLGEDGQLSIQLCGAESMSLRRIRFLRRDCGRLRQRPVI